MTWEDDHKQLLDKNLESNKHNPFQSTTLNTNRRDRKTIKKSMAAGNSAIFQNKYFQNTTLIYIHI
jgi:hypothetical protein